MSSVTSIICAVSRNHACILYEVVSIPVILVSVAVSISTGTKLLTFIDPHAGLKIRMCEANTLIKDSDNDGRMSLHIGILPDFAHADIRAFHECSLRSCRFGNAKREFLIDTVIDKMPLIFQKRVIVSFYGS